MSILAFRALRAFVQANRHEQGWQGHAGTSRPRERLFHGVFLNIFSSFAGAKLGQAGREARKE